MLSFNYVVKDEAGIHARPAGTLVKMVKELDSKITIVKGKKSVEATKLMALMGMGIKQGDEIAVVVEGGEDEAHSLEIIKQFFAENF